MLLERNADVSMQSDIGKTALGNATREGFVSTVKILLEIGHADPNQPAEHDNTPLMLVVCYGEEA